MFNLLMSPTEWRTLDAPLMRKAGLPGEHTDAGTVTTKTRRIVAGLVDTDPEAYLDVVPADIQDWSGVSGTTAREWLRDWTASGFLEAEMIDSSHVENLKFRDRDLTDGVNSPAGPGGHGGAWRDCRRKGARR